ncbi:MAG TPA: D-aminoacylase, partial [Candidatus Paceibacterota bacterium]
MASYSVLIKGGMIARGGNPERLDVGIKDDRIWAVGDLSREKAPVEIDATGRYVSPGFIDLTSHSDTHWTLFDHPSQESFLRQGVTTILGGNCGSSLAPLVKAGDIAGTLRWTDASRSNVNWRNLDEF